VFVLASSGKLRQARKVSTGETLLQPARSGREVMYHTVRREAMRHMVRREAMYRMVHRGRTTGGLQILDGRLML
jgi:hypothetical protein